MKRPEKKDYTVINDAPSIAGESIIEWYPYTKALEKYIDNLEKLQQQDVSEELEEAYKEGIREGYNERHKYD